MQNYRYNFSEFGFSSKIIQDLTQNNSKTKPFIDSFFSLDNCVAQIKSKAFSLQDRQLLVNTLQAQNKTIVTSELTNSNISSLLSEQTYTITTGHQLNFMTGPLYSLYKILQVIVWSEKLKKHSPHYNFVPVFWMATEDHDFEEINHVHLFGSKITLENASQDHFIAGEITASNFVSIKDTLLNKFSDPILKLKIEKYLSFYKNNTLAKASKLLINELFGEYGLVIIDGNDKNLKHSFSQVVKKELKNAITHQIISNTNETLEASGYHQQVYLRECNLFYIENNTIRHRIIKTKTGFEINDKPYTLDELLNLLELYPERFSPNALLRPVYQELVLPNLMYLGGGGEIAYWLQLKDLFKTLKITYPIVKVRDSYILINSKTQSLLEKFKLSPLDLKTDFDVLTKEFVKNNASDTLDLTSAYSIFNKLKSELELKTVDSDIGISRFINGELVKMKSQIEKIEKKLIQFEKKKNEKSLKQLQKLKQTIYPENGFQERFENLLQYVSIPNFTTLLKNEINTNLTETSSISSISLKK